MPETPSNVTIGKSTRESPIASCLSPPGSPNSPMIHGATTMKSAVSAERMSSTSQKRLDATRAPSVPFLQQLGEDRDEGRLKRCVRHQGTDEIRHLERNGERVDLARR